MQYCMILSFISAFLGYKLTMLGIQITYCVGSTVEVDVSFYVADQVMEACLLCY